MKDSDESYELWFRRFEKILTLYKFEKQNVPASDVDMPFLPYLIEELQLFLLDMGQFNACFTKAELDRLSYPKSPFLLMYDHAYLRATNTWAMDMLGAHYKRAVKISNSKMKILIPIWVDSEYFWNELERYNEVKYYDSVHTVAQIVEELTNTATLENLENCLWIQLNKEKCRQDMKQLKKSFLDAIQSKLDVIKIKDKILDKYGKDNGIKYLVGLASKLSIFDNMNADALISLTLESLVLKIIKNKFIFFFRDQFDNKGSTLDCIVVLETKRPYSFINSLGYRIDSVKIIREVLKHYPKLFFEKSDTEKFFEIFSQTELATKTNKFYSDILKEVFSKIITIFDLDIEISKSSLIIKNTLITEELIHNWPAGIKIYAHYFNRCLDKYLEYTKYQIFCYINDAEMQVLKAEFIKAAQMGDLSQVVRITQSVTEIMQLGLDISSESISYSEIIHNQLITAITSNFVQHISLTSYAMKSFTRVLQILEPDDPRHQVNIAVTSQAYFELLENFDRLYAKTNSVSQIRHVEDVKKDTDVVFIELHPNNVAAITQQYEHDAILLLDRIKKWNDEDGYAAKERTIVLDITLNALNDDEVQKVLKESLELIKDGLLNLILIQSLTKFAQLGLDKRSAGCFIIINNGWEPWYIVNKKLKEITVKEQVDKSVESFFTYFACHNDLLKRYIKMVNENVQSVYDSTLKQLNQLETIEHSRFQITMSSDPKACYVAINMNGLIPDSEKTSFTLKIKDIEEFSHILLDYMIYPLCEFYGLPISARASIGFPLTSINIVMDSLRFTIGIESEQHLKQYADILAYSSFVLNRLHEPKLFFIKDTTNRLEWNIKYFEEKVKQYKAMTPGSNYWYAILYHRNKHDAGVLLHREDTEPYILGRAFIFKDGKATFYNEERSFVSPHEPIWKKYGLSIIHRLYDDISLNDQRITTQEKRMMISCFSECFPFEGNGIKVFNQNVKIVLSSRGASLSSFSIVGAYTHQPKCNIYGYELLLENIRFQSGNIILQGEYMPAKHFNIYKGIAKNIISPGYSFEDGKLTVKLKEIIDKNGVSIYGEAINNLRSMVRYTFFEIDYWSEKDPILGRFLRLMTMILIKDIKKINFKAYDTQFYTFITNMNFVKIEDGINDYSSSALLQEWKNVFGKAVDVILKNKKPLDILLSTCQESQESYCFVDGTGVLYDPRWPSSWSGEAWVTNKALIQQALNILRQHVFNEDTIRSSQISEIYYVTSIKYNNAILNNPHLLQSAFRFYGKESINSLIELGEDKELAEQILLSTDELGTKKVLEIFFENKVDTSEQEEITDTIAAIQIKTQEEKILETITQIEAIIGKEALAEITGWHQYVSKALSKNPLSEHTIKVIQAIGNLANSLEEWLDFGIAYEDIDINNQVVIILAQLEGMFELVASGITYVGFPPRYPDFDPDDYYGGSGGGSSSGDGNWNSPNNEQNAGQLILLVGQNATNATITHES